MVVGGNVNKTLAWRKKTCDMHMFSPRSSPLQHTEAANAIKKTMKTTEATVQARCLFDKQSVKTAVFKWRLPETMSLAPKIHTRTPSTTSNFVTNSKTHTDITPSQSLTRRRDNRFLWRLGPPAKTKKQTHRM